MTTIPSPAITIDHEAATAWLVDTPGMSVGWELRNRPCDTCDGAGSEGPNMHEPLGWECPDCDGTGRRTFTLDVAAPFIPYCDVYIEPTTITVHVVAVLPIVDCVGAFADFTDYNPQPAVLFHPNVYGIPPRVLHVGGRLESISLPDSAATGMWAVELVIHT
jgi:hypothetical protein